MKLALAVYRDPALAGVDWDEQYPIARKDLSNLLEEFPDGPVEFTTCEGDHGLGADYPVLIVQIMGIASAIFLGIPTLHKRIRESIEEWPRVIKTARTVIDYVASRFQITSYSMDCAFYCALESLSDDVEVGDLCPVLATTVWGKVDAREPSFEVAPLAYYLFAFREGDESVFVVLVDSKLRVHVRAAFPLDPRS